MGAIIKEDLATETARTVTFNSSGFGALSANKIPAKISAFLNVTAVGATPNLVVKYQYSYDNVLWTDVVSGAFTAVTAISKREFNGVAWPGAAQYYRYVGTITAGTFDFTLKTVFHD